jgi:hypothetical protein
MKGDVRRLALAVLTAAAVGLACACDAAAQARTKAAAKKAADPPAEAESSEGGDAEAQKKAKKKRQDPAEAQRTIEAALKFLEAGKADQAEQALTGVLTGGNLPPAIMAKALLYRGIAYRQQKKPAQAIADLTSALWLKGGLAEVDRKDALRQRTSAYKEAGLSDSGDPVAPAMPAQGATRTASASGVSEGASSSSGVPGKSGSGWGITNPFSGWFSGSSSPPQPAPQPQSQPVPQSESAPPTTASIETARVAAAPGVKSSGWSRSTEVRGTAERASTAAAAQPEGRFRVQVGLARTQAEAQALAARVKREHADVLATREPQIDEAVVGNMGSFYRVRIGPFATAHEGQAACSRLKGPGIDCLVVAQ